MPGRPDVSRQTLVLSDGSGQFAEIRDKKVVRVVDVSFPLPSKSRLLEPEFLELNDHYDAPPEAGLVVEGRGDKMVFVLHANGKTKFIAGKTELLPKALLNFRAQFPSPAGGTTGSFVAANCLSVPVMEDLLRIPTLPEVSSLVLQDFPELQLALHTPFKLIAMDVAKWKQLLEQLKLSPSAPFLKTGPASVVRLEFYP